MRLKALCARQTARIRRQSLPFRGILSFCSESDSSMRVNLPVMEGHSFSDAARAARVRGRRRRPSSIMNAIYLCARPQSVSSVPVLDTTTSHRLPKMLPNDKKFSQNGSVATATEEVRLLDHCPTQDSEHASSDATRISRVRPCVEKWWLWELVA